jgi:hypothetical protein
MGKLLLSAMQIVYELSPVLLMCVDGTDRAF